MIRVGRITYTKGKMTGIPALPNYETIMVMMKSHSKWYPLSPYILQENGQIMENTWQFSKVYSGVVAQSVQKVSRYDPTVAFEFKKHTQIKTTPLGTPVQHELT